MPKKFTVRNPQHPVNVFAAFKLDQKRALRVLGTESIRELLRSECPSVADIVAATMHRHQLLDRLIKHRAELWKAKWLERYGWPFEDCYDETKFRQRVEEEKAKLSAAELTIYQDVTGVVPKLPAPAETPPLFVVDPIDLQTITGPGGYPMARSEFDGLDEENKRTVREYMGQRVRRVIASGFAGVLPTGGIVDRRLVPAALPIPENTAPHLRTPAPKRVFNDPHIKLPAGVLEDPAHA